MWTPGSVIATPDANATVPAARVWAAEKLRNSTTATAAEKVRAATTKPPMNGDAKPVASSHQ